MSIFMVIFVLINRIDMRTGRPVKEETPYKIIIHTNNGRRYASTKISVVDANGRKQYRHKHWGSIDKDNVFHPNAMYFSASPADRASSSFPKVLSSRRPRGAARVARGVSNTIRMM